MKYTVRDLDFYNLPIQNHKGDYDEARRYIADFVSSFPDVRALYEFGSVSAPGISDLDFMVILYDKVNDKNLGEKLTFDQLPADVINLLDGSTFMIFSEEHFKDIMIWDDLRFQKVCGEDVVVHAIDPDQEHLLEICRIMDWGGERIMRLMAFEMTGRIPVKTVLCVLQSFGYTIAKFDNLTKGKDCKGIQILKETQKLRREWFANDTATNREQFISLLYKTLYFGFELLRSMSNYLEENKYYSPARMTEEAYFYLTQKSGYCFEADPEKVNFEYSREISIEKKLVLVAVPSVWYTHFSQYAQDDGIISAAIKNNFVGQFEVPPNAVNGKLRDILIKRISLCNEMALFLKKHKFSKGLFKFGWFYNQ